MSKKYLNSTGDSEVTGFAPDLTGDLILPTDYSKEHDYFQSKICQAIMGLNASAPAMKIIYGGNVTDAGGGQINISEGLAIWYTGTPGDYKLITIPALNNISLPAGPPSWADGRQIWVVGKYEAKQTATTRNHATTGELWHPELEDSYVGSVSTNNLFVDTVPTDAVVWDSFSMNVETFQSERGRTEEHVMVSKKFKTGNISSDVRSIRGRANHVPLLSQTLGIEYIQAREYNFTVGPNPNGVVFDGNYIWTVNWGGGNVSKIDILTGSVVATVPVEFAPVYGAFDGTHLWVTNNGRTTVSKIDVITNSNLGNIDLFDKPRGVAFDGNYIWVTLFDAFSVVKVNISTNIIVATVTVGMSPSGIAFDGTHIWVTNYGSSNVSKIDISSNINVATVTVGANPHGIAFDGTHIWVANFGGHTVSKIDISTNQVVATVAVMDPHGIVFDGTHVWVLHRGTTPGLTKIHVSTNEIVGTATVGDSPQSLGFDGTHIWVTNYNDSTFMKVLA